MVMLLSVVLVPFSEQYARTSVPSEYWQTSAFRTINRKISALWGVTVLVMGLGHIIAGLIDPVRGSRADPHLVGFVLNWGVPVLVVTAAVKLTGRLADQTD